MEYNDIFYKYVKRFEASISTEEVEKKELIEGFMRVLEIWVQAMLKSDSKYIKKDADASFTYTPHTSAMIFYIFYYLQL